MNPNECYYRGMSGDDVTLTWCHLDDGANELLCDPCAVDKGARFPCGVA